MITSLEVGQSYDCPSASEVITKDIGNPAGGRLNKKDGLTRYGNSHVKDKTS